MRLQGAALVVLLAASAAAVPAAGVAAQPSEELPTVALRVPGAARSPAVRVVVGLRDCSARPTATIAATWRGARGPATLRVSGVHRLLLRKPLPASKGPGRIRFQRVRRARPVSRVFVRVSTNWLDAKPGGGQCTLRLPRLVGRGVAELGVVRLRTSQPVTSPSEPPRRTTRTDHVWACGGAGGGTFNCGVTVTVGSKADAAQSEESDDKEKEEGEDAGDDDDPPKDAVAVLAALAALTLGAAGLATSKRSKEGGDVPDTWDELARKAYAEPAEPIAARASDLSKIGAPVAASATAILAVVGGWLVDADPEFRVIGAAAVVAVAVGGLFHVFAADFRSRAAVTVARYRSLCTLANAEIKATDDVRAEADQARTSAEAAEKRAKEAESQAKEARQQADTAISDAQKQTTESSDKLVKRTEELAAAREELRRCQEQAEQPQTDAATEASFLPLEGVIARTAGLPTKIYGVESVGGKVTRYLVSSSDGRLVWVAEAEVSEIGRD